MRPLVDRNRQFEYIAQQKGYSHVGRFYTLPTVANFDLHGLWFYEEIGLTLDLAI